MNRYVKFGLILAAVCLVLTPIGYGIYWEMTHICVEWEPAPTGSKCTHLETYQYPCTHVDHKGRAHTSLCSSTKCTEHVHCRLCTKRVHVDLAPAELTIPQDKC